MQGKMAIKYVLGVVLVIGLALAGWQDSAFSRQGETTLQRIQREGFIRVALHNEVPFAYIDSTGILTGTEGEIVKIIARELGIAEVDPVVFTWEGLIPGLVAGRFDIVGAGMAIRPSRCQVVNFTDPTNGIGAAMVVKKGNPQNIHGYEAFIENPDLRLGVVLGSGEQEVARQIGVPDNQVITFPGIGELQSSLGTGLVDAWVLTSLNVQRYLDTVQPADEERAAPFTQPLINGKLQIFYGGFTVRKEDEDLRQAFNQVIAQIKADGRLLEAVRPFGMTAEDIPPTVPELSADALCAAAG
ncbi:MAG: ectoine/hydroxyectoine ABC transporter substrate-binding protein EhuB [Deinococcus sp.]|nr:ectoine/hydroxyectoine ABC transporter substrate-binding protein EhuB [Deinococcus sp.]